MSTGQTSQTLDALTLPLSGMQLIEASAGTGKTWTLAALYVRLVLGHTPGSDQLATGLYPPQILVMTFTEAATAELRERIRARLAQAARFFQTGDAALADDFLKSLRDQIAPALWSTCAYRLDMAAQWMDDAAIFTIHGWSSRMLKTHAFDSASLFEQSRVEDTDHLKLVATQDYWRRWFYALNAQALDAFKGVGATPQELLKKLKDLWRSSERAPMPVVPPLAHPDALLAQWSAWQQQRLVLEAPARAAWTPALAALLEGVAQARLLKGVRQDYFAGWLAQMDAWAQGDDIKIDTLARFATTALVDKGWVDAKNWPVFDQLETLHAHLQNEPDVATALLAHAAIEVARDYQRAKSQSAQFDFADLLQNLYHALQSPDGRLAAAIRAQFPVALVDEFQDTDPWQFGSLSKIYSCQRNQDKGYSPISSLADVAALDTDAQPQDAMDAPSHALGLIMIGDPKQAIYSFRGADLATYLEARAQVQGIYTLPINFRSTAGVVAAVNRVFGSAKAPFGSVPFEPVQACNAKVLPLQSGTEAQVAMTVWHLPYAKPPRKAIFLADIAAVFASHMVKLLQQGVAPSGDMAVLVRDWREAQAIRDALSARGVRSVYLSERNSVFASVEASDLWRLLRAVQNPGNNRLLRAALATRTWGLAPQVLDALFADEMAWDAVVEQFMQWQRVWRAQGFLPMLSRLLHDPGLAGRVLHNPAQGERSLTNFLHLGELLQSASLQLQGEGALIRYLEDQLRSPQTSGDAAQLRLESDANLVQVVTLHKSKGLEYPLVFLPFISIYRAEDKDSERPDAERLSEDIRLLYVALSRAKQALWLGVAQVKGDVDGKSPSAKSALSVLLGRSAPGDLWERLQTWACEHIAVQAAPEPTLAVYQPAQLASRYKPAKIPQRLLAAHWWSASFSALTRDLAHGKASALAEQSPGTSAQPSERDEQWLDAQLDAQFDTPSDGTNTTLAGVDGSGASDLLSTEPALNAFPAGSRYGTLLHDLLEWQAQHAWPVATSAVLPAALSGTLLGTSASSLPDPAASASPHAAEWTALLTRQSERLNLLPEQVAMLDQWIRAILIKNMPLAHVNKASTAIQLGVIEICDMWPEMGFSLPVQHLASQQLDALITRHIWPKHARVALASRQLEGMLTGFMDLVLRHEGRYYVLDYKSNRLPGYEPKQLQQAMLAHRYDVQAVLYVLALHRLLKSRLTGYDFDQHIGGALYLFLRGVDQPGSGLLHLSPSRELIESLDAAFASTALTELVP
jgi:exodeoxyribonuclease V beta subunit